MSSRLPLPSGRPQRAPRMMWGACDIDSVPPASTTCACSVSISSAAVTKAWKPEPQRRLTPSAGTGTGTPDFRPTWRGR